MPNGKVSFSIPDEKVNFDLFKAIKYHDEVPSYMRVDVIDECAQETFDNLYNDSLTACLLGIKSEEDPSLVKYMLRVNSSPIFYANSIIEHLIRDPKKKEDEAPTLELMHLPSHLKYAYHRPSSSYPKDKLLHVLREDKSTIGWTIGDNKRIKDIIYPISDSEWVSPVKIISKKGGTPVVKNDNNELIPPRTVTGWRVCINYRKLNKTTIIPFIDQMHDRLVAYSYYCFLEGYFGYNQITIAPEDQKKSPFTCPYGGCLSDCLMHQLAFERCMMAIFSDMVEHYIEVFMDYFFVFGLSFDSCMGNLTLVLKECANINLILN
ncbi:Transposon Ty3-G Gag-Pol polyprotein-like protein [Drosera capensis]